MALGTEDLTSMRDELVRARASGTKTVQYSDGRRVEYKTDAEMASAIADLEARIRRASNPSHGVVRFKTSKGF